MQKPSVLVIGPEPRTQSLIEVALRDLAQVASVPMDDDRSAQDYLEVDPGAVIVALSVGHAASFKLVGELVGLGARVIVVSNQKDPDAILFAMRAGAKEFLLETDHEGLRRAVRELAKPPEDPGIRGTVMPIFPTRGGV